MSLAFGALERATHALHRLGDVAMFAMQLVHRMIAGSC
jgi:hypothetical protein